MQIPSEDRKPDALDRPTLIIYNQHRLIVSCQPVYFMDTILVQNSDKDIRECLRRAMRLSPKSRQSIAEELGARLHRRISIESLNKWASEGESERRLPADCILPLSEILSDDSLQRLLLTPRMAECLRLGEWLQSSRWVLEKLDVELPKERTVKAKSKSRKSGRPAGNTANRP